MKKNIKTFLAVALFIFATSSAKAHPTNLSSFMLIQQESGEWMVQLNASLTAFQYEVRYAFGEDSYASPEEFNALVIKHFRQNISVEMNGQKIEMIDGVVALGHAATVGFKLSGIPVEEITEVMVKNDSFKNIGRSQSFFSMLKKGIDNDQFILNAENDFQTKVVIENNELVQVEASSNKNWLIFPMIVLLSGVLVFLIYKVKNTKMALNTSILTEA